MLAKGSAILYTDFKHITKQTDTKRLRTRVPGQAALRAMGRALVQRVLEGSVVIDRGSVVVRRSGFLAKLAVLAIGALQAYIRTRHLQSEKRLSTTPRFP